MRRPDSLCSAGSLGTKAKLHFDFLHELIPGIAEKEEKELQQSFF